MAVSITAIVTLGPILLSSPTYKFVDITMGTATLVTDINDLGQVVGHSLTDSFIWENGDFVKLDIPYEASAWAISNVGHVVGDFNMDDGKAFLWRSDTFMDIHSLGVGSIANDVNDAGQVVGAFRIDPFTNRAFLWQGGTMVELGTLGGSTSVAHAVNERGQVVGSAATSDEVRRPFIWSDENLNGRSDEGEKKQLADLGWGGSANGINNHGVVVGHVFDSDSKHRPVVWSGEGEMTELGILAGEEQCLALAMNNDGHIVGICRGSRGRTGFLWVGGEMYDLLDLVEAGSVTNLGTPYSINDSGVIAGTGRGGFVLRPVTVFHRGDANDDGRVDICDVSFIIGFTLLGSTAPPCMNAADSNGDRRVDIADSVWSVSFLFRGGPPPPDPGPPPLPCGGDPVAGGAARHVGCDSYVHCD